MKCFITSYGTKRYYINGKRVSKIKFYKKYPRFDEKNCLLYKIKTDLKDEGLLHKCEKKLVDCNNRISEINTKIFNGLNYFLNELKEEKNTSLEVLKKDLEQSIKEREYYREQLSKMDKLQSKITLEHNKSLSNLTNLKDENAILNDQLKLKEEFEKELQFLLENNKNIKDSELRNEIKMEIKKLKDTITNLKDKYSDLLGAITPFFESQHLKIEDDIISIKKVLLSYLNVFKDNESLNIKIKGLEELIKEMKKNFDLEKQLLNKEIYELQNNLKDARNKIKNLEEELDEKNKFIEKINPESILEILKNKKSLDDVQPLEILDEPSEIYDSFKTPPKLDENTNSLKKCQH